MDWAEILWVCSLAYLIVPYLLSFCVTAHKRLRRLNSNLVDTIPPKLVNGLSWNFVQLLLNSYANWTQICWPKFFIKHWAEWPEILWVCPLGYLIVLSLFSFCVTAPKQLRQLNLNLEDTTPSKPLNRLSWNFVGMIFRIFSCALST